jgi:antitoxin ParD1/3/4
METMNYTVPESLKEFVLERVSERGFDSVSEYIGELIRADQKQKAWSVLEVEVLKGIESGPPEPWTEDDWASLRARVRNRKESGGT